MDKYERSYQEVTNLKWLEIDKNAHKEHGS